MIKPRLDQRDLILNCICHGECNALTDFCQGAVSNRAEASLPPALARKVEVGFSDWLGRTLIVTTIGFVLSVGCN